jgi:hypothetical protein
MLVRTFDPFEARRTERGRLDVREIVWPGMAALAAKLNRVCS